MPIIEENGGWAIFNGTPRGKNHAYRSLKAARSRDGAFGEMLGADQTGVFQPEQLERIRSQLIDTYGEEYGQAVFDQEYMVSFEAANIGAILGRWIAKADKEGRISDKEECQYDYEGAPIEISSDIGRRDASSWFFWQPCVGGFRIVDHDRDSGMDADEWCDRLQRIIENRGYKLGRIWLPHDARAKTFAAKHSAVEIFISRFGTDKVGIVPDGAREDRINAARKVIRACTFLDTATEKGRDGLTSWCYEYDEERKEFSKEPRHDWASHDGDAFSYGAMIMQEREIVKPKVVVPRQIVVGGESTLTIDDMWKIHDQGMRRGARI
jgi:phage terminase large subunit